MFAVWLPVDEFKSLIPFLNLVGVNGLRSSDGSPFQRTAPECPKLQSLKIVSPWFGYTQDVLRATDIVIKVTNRDHILHVDDFGRSFLYHIRLKLVQISFILNLLKPIHDLIHKKVANCYFIFML